MILALLVTSFLVGVVVTFVLPWVMGLITSATSSNATLTSLLQNQWVMLLVVGLVVATGILAFSAVAKHIPGVRKEIMAV